MSSPLSRRRFLEISSLAGAAFGLTMLSGRDVWAAGQPDGLMLFCYFSGGWDQLLALDPRPNNDPKFSQATAYNPGTGSGIHPAYDQVIDTAVAAILTANPSGIQTAGNLTFGPAVAASLLAHSADLAIVRGVNMDTLTHEVGRRYFLTGKFPRGLAPNGSSLNTVAAGQQLTGQDLPNLALGMESYNEGWPAAASPIFASGPTEILSVLTPLGATLASPTDAALLAHEQATPGCTARGMDSAGLVSLFRGSRVQARTMTNPTAAALFNFNLANPSPSVQPLIDAFGIANTRDLNSAKGRAAVAAQALCKGVSQAVAVELANGLDDHFDWDLNHAPSLRDATDTLGRLIAYLKTQPYKGNASDSVWKHTTLVVFSEFARTPLINGRGGRDHHLASSCLVAGPGLKGNQVVGGTSDLNMTVEKLNLTTGKVDPAGVLVRPSDVHATVLQSMGLTQEHLANQSPQIISALLK